MADKNEKLGALWAKTSSKGDYFSGEITINGTTHKLVVFANSFKDAANKPDFVIYRSLPRDAA